MIDWYGVIVGTTVNLRSPYIAFISNDHTHHRIALLALPGPRDDPEKFVHSSNHEFRAPSGKKCFAKAKIPKIGELIHSGSQKIHLVKLSFDFRYFVDNRTKPRTDRRADRRVTGPVGFGLLLARKSAGVKFTSRP